MTQAALVTGAGGFVGAAIAERLVATGWAVQATDAAFDAPTRARLAGATLTSAPLPVALADAQAADVVIHAAFVTASPAERGETAAAHIRTNTALLLEALSWARARRAGRFVFLSSSGVFGDAGPDGAEADEDTPATATDPYSAAKRAGEVLLSGAAEAGFKTLSLRLGPLFGPHEVARPTRPRPSLVARMLAEARTTGRITVTTPDARRDWTFLPDLARAVEWLLTLPRVQPGLLHLTSGQALRDAELAALIAGQMPGTQVTLAPDPVAPPPRPVMSSRHPLPGFTWTPTADALATLTPQPGIAAQ